MRPRAPTARLAGSVPLPLGSALAGRVNEPGILGETTPVKIGFCMLLWTTHVTDAHRAIIEDIKATGYDGIEIPVFEGSPDHYAKLGRMLDEIGLERTAITVIPSLDKNPLGDEGQRQAAVDYLRYCTDCAAALGAPQLAGPVHQTIGHFSGAAPTETERERAREVHRKAGDYAAGQNVRLVLEAINRFECYFANTIDDLSAYLNSLGAPRGDRHVRHVPRQHRGTGPGGGVHAGTRATSATCTSRRTTAACRGAGTCRGRRRSRR